MSRTDTDDQAGQKEAGSRPRMLRGVAMALAIVCLIVGGLVTLVRLGPLTDAGRRFIESSISGQSAGQLGRLRLAGLHGDIWTDFRVDRLTISDKDGVWLDARNVRLKWDPMALIRRRLRLQAFSAANVLLDHRPTLTAPGQPTRQQLSVELDNAAFRLELSPGLAQVRGVYDIRANMVLERDGPIRGRVHGASVLHPGDFLDADFAISGQGAFKVNADAVEARGGAMAGVAGLAPKDPFRLVVRVDGDARAGQFSVDSKSGALTPIVARGFWNPTGGTANGQILLSASSLLATFQKAAGPIAVFHLEGRRHEQGLYDMTLSARSDNILLNAGGEADPARRALVGDGVQITLNVNDPGRILSFPRTGPARLSGKISGDTRRWRFVGNAIVDRLTDSAFSLSRISAPLRVDAHDGEFGIEASAVGEGGSGQGLVAALLGASPRATAKFSVFADGRLLVRALDMTGAGLTLSASGDRGLLGDLSFKGSAVVSNLAVAHPGAGGVVSADWTARQSGGDQPWAFGLDAHGERLATGLGQEVDRMLGASPRLRAEGRVGAAGVEVSQASLDGAAGSANTKGTIGAEGGLKLALGWAARGPMRIGPLVVDGASKGTGDIAGSLTRPSADLVADIDSIDLPSLPVRGARLVVNFATAADGANGRFALSGNTAYGPAKAAATFRFASDGLDLTALDMDGAGVTARGSAALRSGQPSSADLTVGIGPGVLLAEGTASARVRLEAATGGPRADLTIDATNAVLAQGGGAVATLRLSAKGPLSHLPFDVSATGIATQGRWRVAGNGVYQRAGSDNGISFSGAGRVGKVDFHTLAPAVFDLGAHQTQARLQLAVGTGRADIALTNGGGAVDVRANVSDLSLSLLSQDYIGRFNANLALQGRGDNLTGMLEAKLAGAGGRDLRGAPPVDGDIKARLAAGAIIIDATLGNSQGLKATSDLTLPAVATAAPFHIAVNTKQPMNGRFAIDGELKPIWDLLMGGDRSLAGRVVASATLGGTLADPRATGTASLDNGSFRDSGTGLKLSAITVRATMANNAIDFSQFSASDAGRGQMTGGGRISLLRDGESSLRLDLKRFRLIDNDFAEAAASGQVSVNRAADGHVKLTGDLAIDQALVSPVSPVATGVVPMEVVEIHRPVDVENEFAVGPRGAAPVALDMRLHSSGGILVRGRGLNLELSLDASVGGTTDAPLLSGSAHVVRGDYNFAGQRFTINDNGVVHLGATPETIRLDLTATREDPTLTAVIRIQGTAAKPTITLTSSPVLPQDEVLSQVLFGASVSQLTPFQAAQLASAVSGLATGGGFDVIGGLRSFAHLDRLAIGGTAATGTTVSGGKYLTNNVYLEIIGGGRQGSGAQVEWQVRRHVSLVSRLLSQGDSQVSVRWRTDY